MGKKIAVVGVPGGWSSELLADAVERKTGFRLLVDMEDVVMDFTKGTLFYKGHDLGQMDGIILKKLGPVYSPDLLDRLEMLRYLEEKGMRIFSPAKSIMGLLDRLSCTVSLQSAGAPMPPTVITESVEEAAKVVREYGRAIFKPLFTSKARGMGVIHDGPELEEEIRDYKGAGNQVMYVQRMIDDLGSDLGVAFLGGEYLATYARRGSEKSWNTTINSGGKYVPYEPSQEIIDMAAKAQALFNLDFTTVDVVETPDGPKVFEVSAFGGFRGLKDANGLDAADLYSNHVLKTIGG